MKLEGKIYTVAKKDIMLYPISYLAFKLSKALKDERTTQTIRKWEVNGVIPPSIFRIGTKRLYSAEQVETICRVAKECNIRQGSSASLSEFSNKIFVELKKVNDKLKKEYKIK
jgi:hypothetical protein